MHNEIKIEKLNKCPLCGSVDLTITLASAKDLINHIDSNEYSITKCSKCGISFTNPRIKGKYIAEYYPETYHCYKLDTKSIDNAMKSDSLLGILRKISVKILNPLGLDIEKMHYRNVLEVGCGSGSFLYRYKKLHPLSTVVGVDFNDDVISNLRGIGITSYVSDLNDLSFLDKNSFDVVFAFMILEHVYDINKILKNISSVLQTNGELIITIPNIDSWQLKLFREWWFPLQVPTHIYHYSVNTISILLNDNGFKIKNIIYQRTFTDFIQSINLILVNQYGYNNLFAKLTRWNLIWFAITYPFALIQSLLHNSSRLTIVAERNEP